MIAYGDIGAGLVNWGTVWVFKLTNCNILLWTTAIYILQDDNRLEQDEGHEKHVEGINANAEMTDQSEDELNDLLMAEFESEACDGDKDASVHQIPLKTPSPEKNRMDDERQAGNKRITTKQQNYEQILVDKPESSPQETLKGQQHMSQSNKGVTIEDIGDHEQSMREKSDVAKQLPSTQVQKSQSNGSQRFPWHKMEAAKSVKSPQAPGNALSEKISLKDQTSAVQNVESAKDIGTSDERPFQENKATGLKQNINEMNKTEMISQKKSISAIETGTDPAIMAMWDTRGPVLKVQRRNKREKVYHYIELLNPESPVYDQDLDTALRDLSKASNCMEGDQLLSGLTKQQHSWYMTNRGMPQLLLTMRSTHIEWADELPSRKPINRSGFPKVLRCQLILRTNNSLCC